MGDYWRITDAAFHKDPGPWDDDDIDGLIDDYNHDNGTDFRWQDDGGGALIITDGAQDWPIGETLRVNLSP